LPMHVKVSSVELENWATEYTREVMTSSDFGSTQGVRKRVYIALIKEEFADARPRWAHPSRTGQKHLSTVSALLSATKELSEKLASQETVTLASMPHEPWYRGPKQVGILGNAPYPNDPGTKCMTHKEKERSLRAPVT
jgi:hypothetical protein